MLKMKKAKLYALLSGPVAFYVFFVIVPMGISVFYSLYSWKGGVNKTFVGLGNYGHLLRDASFWQAFRNNLWAIVVCFFGHCLLGYVYAAMLTSRYIRARKIYRFAIFMPVILSGVVVGYLWKMIYNENPGLLNNLLRAVGLGDFTQLWLGDVKIAMTSIIIIMVWQAVGLHMVIYMASLQNISPDIIEAAVIDGASAFQRFLHVTTPLMFSTLRVSIVLMITGTMKMFEYVYVTTRGAPGGATNVLTYYAYNTGFVKTQLGYANTVAVGTIVLSMVMVGIVNLVMRWGGKKYE